MEPSAGLCTGRDCPSRRAQEAPSKTFPARAQGAWWEKNSQASETRGEGCTTPRPRSRAPWPRWPNLPLAHQPYVFKEGQEPLRQLQSDGASHLPICQAECVAEDSQGLHTDVAVGILQLLHDLWQQALQSYCLHETQQFFFRNTEDHSSRSPLLTAGAAQGRGQSPGQHGAC